MTKDDIIQMARVAGVRDDGHRFEFSEIRYLERFAELLATRLAEHEREACAKVCDRMWHEWLDSPEENEPNKPDAEDCAKAIRARK